MPSLDGYNNISLMIAFLKTRGNPTSFDTNIHSITPLDRKLWLFEYIGERKNIFRKLSPTIHHPLVTVKEQTSLNLTSSSFFCSSFASECRSETEQHQ